MGERMKPRYKPHTLEEKLGYLVEERDALRAERDHEHWKHVQNAEEVGRLRAERDDLRIAQQHADGALADAATVPTGNLERGIRMLTAERDTLAGRIKELEEEIEALSQALVDADRPYSQVRAERTRQELLRAAGKFLYTCASPDFAAFSHFGRVAVLGEEYGEVCRAALDVEKVAEGRHDTNAARIKLRTELIQVAAVAVAYIEGLDAALAADARRDA